MTRPSNPISKEARDFLKSKLERMKGIEKEKTIKRLREYDRGNRTKERDGDWKSSPDTWRR